MAESHQDEIAKLEALYDSNPRGRVFTHLAEAYRKAGRLDRAREIVQDGLRYHEDYASAHVVLGRIFTDLGRADDAAPEFRRVLELDPENRIALRGLGEYEQRRGNAGVALDYFRQLARFDPGDEELAHTIEELERLSASPAPSTPPAYGAPSPDVFGDYPEPYAGGLADAGYGYTQPPAAPPPPQEEAGPAPTEFEPLPLSMDWPASDESANSLDALTWGADASQADAETMGGGPASDEPPMDAAPEADGGAVSDLRLEQDLGERGDAPSAAGPGVAESVAADGGQAFSGLFDMDAALDAREEDEEEEATDAARSPADATAAWGSLDEAATTALPPADYDALPPGEARPEDEEGTSAASEAAAAFASWEPGREDADPAAADPAAGMARPDVAGDAGATSTAPAEAEDAKRDDIVDDRDLPDAAETEVYTETLAELYRAQGFTERAAEVYRALLADRPGDERLLTRLREIEGSEIIDPAPASADAAESWSQLAESMDRSAGAEEAAAAQETERAEPEWMESVEAAWTGGSGATSIGDSMFAPPADEPAEEAGSGEPVGAVLHALLDWRPTRQPQGDPEEEILLLDEVVDHEQTPELPGWDDEDASYAAADDDLPGWEDGYEQGAASVEQQASPSGGQPDPWDERPAASGAEGDPWDAPAPESESDAWAAGESAAGADAMPWEHAESGEAPGGGDRMPWEDSGDRASDTVTGTPREHDGAWDAVESADDPLLHAAGPGGVGNPFEEDESPGAARGPDAGSAELPANDEDDDDDDLEMFRSWLQSLKR